MRAALRAVSARLSVGLGEWEPGGDLLGVVEPRGKSPIFCLAEPDGLGSPVLAVAGGRREHAPASPARLGKLLLETVAHEYGASSRSDPCDSLVDGLRAAHRQLGSQGLDLVVRGNSGVGFCGATIVDRTAQIVVVPPCQAFILHQTAVQAVPETSELGRGIWMRDD
ncbi:MAG: hypothetical protein ACYDAG_18365, partial [Chloroflexota bacterium]